MRYVCVRNVRDVGWRFIESLLLSKHRVAYNYPCPVYETTNRRLCTSENGEQCESPCFKSYKDFPDAD
jgi:hypothetical protein